MLSEITCLCISFSLRVCLSNVFVRAWVFFCFVAFGYSVNMRFLCTQNATGRIGTCVHRPPLFGLQFVMGYRHSYSWVWFPIRTLLHHWQHYSSELKSAIYPQVQGVKMEASGPPYTVPVSDVWSWYVHLFNSLPYMFWVQFRTSIVCSSEWAWLCEFSEQIMHFKRIFGSRQAHAQSHKHLGGTSTHRASSQRWRLAGWLQIRWVGVTWIHTVFM